MRAPRDGLEALGFDSDVFLKHAMAKPIFRVDLISNLQAYLLGMAKTPKYLMPRQSPKKATEAIAEWWMERWAAKRLTRPEAWDQLAEHTLVHPISHGARVLLPDDRQLDLFPSSD